MKAVVLHWNNPDGAARAAHSILESDEGTEVCVVDNGSPAAVYGRLTRMLPFRARVVRLEQNLGYSGGMNWALHNLLAMEDDLVLLCSHSVAAFPGCLTLLVDAARRNLHYAVLGPELIYDGEESANCVAGREEVVQCEWVNGAALLVRPSAVLAVGGFDEELFAYYEDVDVCKRLRNAGWKVGIVTRARMLETRSVVSVRERVYLMTRNSIKYARKQGVFPAWRGTLEHTCYLVRPLVGSLASWRSKARRALSREVAVGQAWGVVDGVRGVGGLGRLTRWRAFGEEGPC